MIYCVTGKPGSGKSLYAVSVIFDTIGKTEVYTNIENLRLYHKKIYDIREILQLKNRCLIVIDEAQNYFHKLSSEFLEFFTYHRHYSIDIILIVQNLNMLDKKLIELIEYEVHFLSSSFRLSSNFVAVYRVGGEVFMTKKMSLSRFYDFYRSFNGPMQKKSSSIITKYVVYVSLLMLVFVGSSFYLIDKFKNPASLIKMSNVSVRTYRNHTSLQVKKNVVINKELNSDVKNTFLDNKDYVSNIDYNDRYIERKEEGYLFDKKSGLKWSVLSDGTVYSDILR